MDVLQSTSQTAQAQRMKDDQPSTAGKHDYEAMYPPDKRYHELDQNARVWRVYNNEASEFDNAAVGESGQSLDVLLLFSAIFASVLTTFVAQTSQSLSPDNSAISVSLLAEIAALQRAMASGGSVDSIPITSTTATSPSPAAIYVNGLWFISLVLSLLTALLAVYAKQWLHHYNSIIKGTPRERAFIRHKRYRGLKKWKVREITGLLPTFLHSSLSLSLVGLVIFLSDLNHGIAIGIGALCAPAIILHFTAATIPLFLPFCQYRTPLSDLLYKTTRSFLGISPRSVKKAERESVKEDVIGREALFHDIVVDALLWLKKTTNSAQAGRIIKKACGALLPSLSPSEKDTKAYELLSQAGPAPLAHWEDPSFSLDDVENFLRADIVLWSTLLDPLSRKHQQGATISGGDDINLACTIASLSIPSSVKLGKDGVQELILKPHEALRTLVGMYSTQNVPVLPFHIWRTLYQSSNWHVPDVPSDLNTVTNSFACLVNDAKNAPFPHPVGKGLDQPITLAKFLHAYLFELGWFDSDVLSVVTRPDRFSAELAARSRRMPQYPEADQDQYRVDETGHPMYIRRSSIVIPEPSTARRSLLKFGGLLHQASVPLPDDIENGSLSGISLRAIHTSNTAANVAGNPPNVGCMPMSALGSDHWQAATSRLWGDHGDPGPSTTSTSDGVVSFSHQSVG